MKNIESQAKIIIPPRNSWIYTGVALFLFDVFWMYLIIRYGVLLDAILMLLIVNILAPYFALRQYKVFISDTNKFVIHSQYLSWLIKDVAYFYDDIKLIKVIQWTYLDKASPVILISSYTKDDRMKTRKVYFRMSDRREEFLSLLDLLRSKGIEIVGGFWHATFDPDS